MIELLNTYRTELVYIVTLACMWTWESVAPFFKPTAHRIRHDMRNLLVGLVNGVVLAIAFAGLMQQVTGYVWENSIGLVFLFPIPAWGQILIAFVLLDLWNYLWHRINHRVPFFWRFHRLHHSDNAMDATSASRFHVGEIILSVLVRLPVIALIGVPLVVVVTYDTILLACTIFHHSNIGFSKRFDKSIALITVSPFMHKVHHSRLQPETDSNYSSVLSIWDRIFGTYREREDYHQINFGLDGFDTERKQTLKGLFSTPFVDS